MKSSTERRLLALERKLSPPSGSAVLFLREHESVAQAVQRLGLVSPKGMICVPEVLSAEDWCRTASLQQSNLIRESQGGNPK
jgi:hypothetical protein